MQYFLGILLFLCVYFAPLHAQQKLDFPPDILEGVSEIWMDDYGDLYFLNPQQLNFTKYDSLGKKMGNLSWTLPFQVLSVKNPLTIPLFSEGAQTLQLVDSNLAPIQDPISFSPHFFHVKAVYVENLQYLWVIDDARQTLAKVDYRTQNLIRSSVFSIDFNRTQSFIIANNQLYLNQGDTFEVYNFHGKLLFKRNFKHLEKIKKEGKNILIFLSDRVLKYTENKEISTIFQLEKPGVIAGNFKNWVALQGDKLYLYQRKK